MSDTQSVTERARALLERRRASRKAAETLSSEGSVRIEERKEVGSLGGVAASSGAALEEGEESSTREEPTKWKFQDGEIIKTAPLGSPRKIEPSLGTLVGGSSSTTQNPLQPEGETAPTLATSRTANTEEGGTYEQGIAGQAKHECEEVVAKDALLEVYALQETSWKASGTGGRDQGTAKSLEPNVPARESLQAQLANPSTRSSDHYLATRSIVQSTQPSRNLAPNIDVQKPRPVVEYVPQPSFDDYAFPSFTPPDAFFTPTHTVPPPPSAATGYPPRRPSQNGSTQIWSPAPPTKPVTVSRPSISGPTLTPTSGSRVATQSPSVGSNGTSSMQQKTTSSLSSNAPAFESPSNAQTLAPPVSSSPRKVLLRGRTKSAENLRTPVLEKKPREEEVKKAEKVEKEHEKVEGKKPDSCAKEEQEVVFEPKEKKVEETRAVEKKIGLQTKPKLNANEETKREKKWVQSSKGQEKTVASKGKNVQQVKEPEKAIEKTEANNSKKETLLEEKVTPKVESRERAESIVGEIGPSSLVTLSPQSAKFVSQSPVQLDLPVADPRFSTVYALLHSTLLENAKLTLRLEAMTSAVSNGHDKVSSQDQKSDPSTTTKQSELLQEALSTIVYLEDDLSFSTRETAKLLLENGKPRSDLELALNEYQELLEVSRRVAASRLGGGGGGGSGGSTKGKEVGGGTKSRGGEEGKGGGENGSRELKRTIDGFQQTGPI